MSGRVLIRMTLLVPLVAYPLQSLAFLYLSIRTSIASAKRIYALLDLEGAYIDLPNAMEPKPLSSNIRFSNVGYTVNNAPILHNISFEIPKHSRVVIYGPSGAGKTTLLSLVAGFIRPSRGEIRIDGVPLQQLKGAVWRSRLGIVTQEPILLNGTVRDNLLYASPDADDARLKAVLREALLWNDDCVFAQGLDTPVGNRGDLISGGERQRLTIARSLLKHPEVMILDEPTAMLDNENRIGIVDTILSVSKGRTMIIVTHDLSLQKIADIHLNIRNGRLEK